MENPILLIVALIASLVAGFIYLWNNCETFRNFWIGLWEGISNAVLTAVNKVIEFFTNLYTNITILTSTCIETIKIIWGIISDWFYTNIIQPLSAFFISLWETISTKAQEAWNFIVLIWESVSSWFNDNIITPISSFFDEMWSKLKNGASQAWEGIKSIFSNITNWFRTQFSNAWQAVKNVFSTGGQIFDGIKEGILSGLKSVINGLISGINKVIKVPFDGINSALNKIKSIDIPGIGKPFGGLPTISTPQIPQLRYGIGLAKKGHQYLLEGHGDEQVIPISEDEKWTSKVAMKLLKAVNQQKVSTSNRSILNSAVNNETIVLNAELKADIEMSDTKVGRIVTPVVIKTLKQGGDV